MVSEDEIANVAKLMRIDIDDHSLHIKRVQRMLEYFDILDKADIESVELLVQETELEKLRTDNYIPYEKKLIDFLNCKLKCKHLLNPLVGEKIDAPIFKCTYLRFQKELDNKQGI